MKPACRAMILVLAVAFAAGCSFFDGKTSKAVEPPKPADHFAEGVRLEKDGAFEQAIVEYRRATQDDPADSRAWVNLGRLFAKAGDPATAVACWKQAVHANPSDAKAWNLLGGVAMRDNDFREAMNCYRKAIDGAPDAADPYYNAAIASRQLKNDADAAKYYKRWLDLTPTARGRDADEAHRFLEARGEE